MQLVQWEKYPYLLYYDKQVISVIEILFEYKSKHFSETTSQKGCLRFYIIIYTVAWSRLNLLGYTIPFIIGIQLQQWSVRYLLAHVSHLKQEVIMQEIKILHNFVLTGNNRRCVPPGINQTVSLWNTTGDFYFGNFGNKNSAPNI